MLTSLFRIIIFLSFVFPIKVWAQELVDLPKITPSYSENFQDYKSYPSMCFENAYKDRNGRLWLKTCGSASMTSSLHLFQFDGYRFQLIQGELEQLRLEHEIFGMYQERELVGLTYKKDKNQLFFYDLETNHLTFHDLNLIGFVMDLTVTEERIFLTVVNNEIISLYEWKDGKLEAQGSFSEPDLLDFETEDLNIEPFHHDENFFWAFLRYAKYILRIDKKTGKLKKFSFEDFESKNQKSAVKLPEISILTPVNFIAQGDNVYIFTQFLDGRNLFKLDVISDNFIPVDNIPANWRGEIVFQDQKGNLLFLFKSENNKYKAILQDTFGQRFDYSDFVEDIQDIRMIISSDYKQEVIICSTKGISVHEVKATEAIQHFLSGYQIRAMSELLDERILVGTQLYGQFIINRKTNEVTPLKIQECELGWTRFHLDETGNIWTLYNNDIIKYDPISNTCIKLSCQTENLRLFTFVSKNKIAIIDRFERLYIHDIVSQKTEPFLENGEVKTFAGYTHEIIYGQNDLLWVATAHGLWKINLSTSESEVFGLDPPFQDSRFLSMHEDENGRLWLGTPLHGLYIFDPITEEIQNLSSEDGLPNNTIASIVSDEEGMRWIGTYNGISLVSSEGDLITNIYPEDGLIERENNRYASLKTRDGKLFIGTINGLNYIDPIKIKEKLTRNEDLKIFLTYLSHFDAKTRTDKIQEYGLANLGTIHLPPSRRFLNLRFALSNYFKPNENQFAYMLEGEDEDWISIGNQQSLNLNNLPAGKYRLLIKGSDGLGNWTQDPLVINIQANEFFFKQAWFYLICLMAVVGVSLLWISRLRVEVKKATKTIIEDKETIERQAEELKELDKVKSQFFTNISHEFRTPLTIISGIVDQVKSKPEVWLEKGTKMIKQNTLNLLSLINQILELRQLESKALTLNLIKGDIIKYLKFFTESYYSYAENNGLHLHFVTTQPSVIMDYDPEKFFKGDVKFAIQCH